SALWTEYLARSSTEWRARVGSSLLPRWPTGIGGKGNEGVASYVQRTRFALGYVEHFYSREHHLSEASLRNHAGEFVQAGPASFRAAATAANWLNAALQQIPTDAPGAGSWPITGASFILISSAVDDAPRTLAVLRFFDWSFTHGGAALDSLQYC